MSIFKRIAQLLRPPTSRIEQYENDVIFGENEVGFTHPETGACIKFKDEGEIDLFCGDRVGMRLDQDNATVHMMGDVMVFKANHIDFQARDLTHNGHNIGSFLGSLLADTETDEYDDYIPKTESSFAEEVRDTYINGSSSPSTPQADIYSRYDAILL